MKLLNKIKRLVGWNLKAQGKLLKEISILSDRLMKAHKINRAIIDSLDAKTDDHKSFKRKQHQIKRLFRYHDAVYTRIYQLIDDYDKLD